MSFRPSKFSEFIGNKEIVERLQLIVKVCKEEGSAPPHIALFGPPGTGKTTLANIVCLEYGGTIFKTTGASIRDQEALWLLIKDIAKVQQQKKVGFLFIDEIHDLYKASLPESIWLPIFEEFIFYSNLIGEVIMDARENEKYTIVENIIKLDPFTIIGATTNPEGLSKPLRDRFKFTGFMEDYSQEDMEQILAQYVSKSGFKMSKKVISDIARRSRFNPRVGINLVDACIFRAKSKSAKVITKPTFTEEMTAQRVDILGLTEQDRKILRILESYPLGIGIGRLANMMIMKAKGLTEIYEGYLEKIGLITACPKGRMITEKGIKHLGGKNK